MPRRASTRNAPRQETPPPVEPVNDVQPLEPLAILRRQWKWAAFSQFFFTFNHLFNMTDVSLIQIEQDLVNGTHVVIPRIMQRLLFTISYDRKINLDNWQTALRKQYRKRDPAANPIGPEPRVEVPDEQASSPPPEESIPIPELKVEDFDKKSDKEEHDTAEDATATDAVVEKNPPESTRASTLEPAASVKGTSVQPSEIDSELPSTRYASVGGDANEDEGEQEESKNWLELPMLEKLDTIHLLTEWQFQSPMRLRQLMRSDDETATWRVEPIGYDAKHNAYWLIGTDRLWIQRPLPKPPKPKKTTKTLKRKRAPAKSAKSGKGKGKGRAEPASVPASKRPRLAKEKDEVPTGRGRAAKAQAKTKLEQQAAQLAATKKEIEMEAKRAGTRSSPRKAAAASASAPPAPRGTRASRRLRGKADDEDEEWQAVPDEWLDDGKEVNGRRISKRHQALKTGLESEGSEISDLTELSEENSRGQDDEDVAPVVEDEDDEDEDEDEQEQEPQVEEPALPADFIEWETIAVTLYEWEHVADQFEKATHYLEKALYKVLVNDLIPPITEELREIERKERMEAALNQRKRSSRLLIRQSMKEEAEAAARKQAEEEEKNSRARRQAVRAEKQEDARAQRETAREQRKREREEREERERIEKELAEQREKERQERLANGIKDEEKDGKAKTARSRSKKAPRQNGRQASASKSGSRTPGEEWEVDCEICLRRGRNIDDGIPMASCGNCGKWQHIPCHDAADQQAGRRKRNWNSVDFICQQCQLAKAAHHSQARYNQMQMHNAHPGQNQNPYAHLVSGTSAYPTHPSYMGPVGNSMQHAGYPVVASTNGRGMGYGREYQGVGEHDHASPHPPQPIQYSHQPYGGGVSFTHYQPHLREFSANPQAYSSSHVRAYGHSQVPYSQYQASSHPYQAPPAPAAQQWGANSTSYHQISSQRHSPAEPAVASSLPQAPPNINSYASHWQQQPLAAAQQSQPQQYPASTYQQPSS